MKLTTAPTLIQRFGRGLLGLVIGWVMSSVVALIWCGIGIVYYGDLDEALAKLKSEPFAPAVFGGVIGGMTGSWIAAGVAPTVLGACLLRRPVLTTAVYGGVAAALLTTGVGTLAADSIAERFPKSDWIVLAPLFLGIIGGVLIGWRVGSRLSSQPSPPDNQIGQKSYDEYDDS